MTIKSAIVFLTFFLAIFIVSFDYIFSSYFYSDDLIYIGSAIFGDPIDPPKNWLHYFILYSLADIGGLSVKLYPSVIAGLSGLAVFTLARQLGFRNFVSVCIASFVVFFPIYPQQSFFLTGAHGSVAVLAVLGALVVHNVHLKHGSILSTVQSAGLIIVQALLVISASFLSPSFGLAPVLVVVFVVSLFIHHLRTAKPTAMIVHSLIIVVVIVAAWFAILSAMSYHYSGAEGWVSLSVLQIIENLIIGVETVILSPILNNSHLVINYFYLLIPLFVLALYFRTRNWASSNVLAAQPIIVVALIALLVSALSFGPASIITAINPRHVQGAGFFGLLALTLLCAYWIQGLLLSRPGKHLPVFKYGLIILMGGLPLAHFLLSARNFIGPQMESHRIISGLLNTVEIHESDQVLILLPESYPSPTMGFNHWSTWYLRLLTGHNDIIGLIGTNADRVHLENNGVFVDHYADHGGQYWSVENGRAVRLRMLGLENSRPLFAFAPDDDGTMTEQQVNFFSADGDIQFRFGMTPEETSIGASWLCADNFRQPSINIVARGDQAPRLLDYDHPESVIFMLTEELFFPEVALFQEMIRLPPSTLVHISIELASLGSVDANWNRFSATTPPMPFLSAGLAAYEQEAGLLLLSQNSDFREILQRSENNIYEIDVLGCHARRSLVFGNGELLGVADGLFLQGEWTFGQGHLERIWTGSLSRFDVSVEGE